jgi:hypothetical protein
MGSKSENLYTEFSCSSSYLRILLSFYISLNIFEYHRNITDTRKNLIGITEPILGSLYLETSGVKITSIYSFLNDVSN